MTILHYIDNEPASGEWTSTVPSGGSTIVRTADAAWPERGSYGLRFTVSGTSTAYVSKTTTTAIGAGGTFDVGMWLRFPAYPSDTTMIAVVYNQAAAIVGILYHYASDLRWRVYDDAVVLRTIAAYVPPTNRWLYVVLRLLRATGAAANDGGGDMYLNGGLVASNHAIDLYDRMPNIGDVRLGVPGMAHNGYVLDIDEVKLSVDQYPEPYTATPATDYPEAARTVLLYRPASADSFSFADYCVTALDIPRANLCPLPNASATESLADYAAFQAQVETDLAAWLARNPTIAANCTTFLTGYGVPGGFASGGILHSTASRLMHYGSAFSSQTDNPLYAPATVTRPTVSSLRAAGIYLATRIDADTLAHAEAIVDRGCAVTGPDNVVDFLVTDQAGLMASLATQHTRVLVPIVGDCPTSVAFVIAEDVPGLNEWPPHEGSQIALAELGTSAQTSLRADISELTHQLLSHDFASGLGFSALPADGFNSESFLEMLLIGGTFAEAVAVAVEHVDYTAVPVGDPLMTVTFDLGGYNIYHGLGGPEAVDWGSPVAYCRRETQYLTVPLVMEPGEWHILAVRAVSDGGIEERNTDSLVYVALDGTGALKPPLLPRPVDVTAQMESSGVVSVGFSCCHWPGMETPTSFEVLTDRGSGTLDTQNPAASISVSGPEQTDFLVSVVPDSLPAKFAVRSRRGDSCGAISRVVTVKAAETPHPPIIF